MRNKLLINLVLLSSVFILGCVEKPVSKDPNYPFDEQGKITVTGEILFSRTSDWNPNFTVIKDQKGNVKKVRGVWGAVGDEVTVTSEEYSGD